MKVPSYCRHKAKGMAFVKIHGRMVFLGKYGSTESIKRYERAIAEHLAGVPRDDVATVVELCASLLVVYRSSVFGCRSALLSRFRSLDFYVTLSRAETSEPAQQSRAAPKNLGNKLYHGGDA